MLRMSWLIPRPDVVLPEAFPASAIQACGEQRITGCINAREEDMVLPDDRSGS